MRFLEKHSNSILGDKSTPLSRGVVPVDINEVSKWHFSQPQIEQSIREQFPCVVAPGVVTFCEYKLPLSWMVVNTKTSTWEKSPSGHGPSDYFGMLIIQEVLEPGSGADAEAVKALLANVQGDVQVRYKHYTFCFAGNADDRDVMFWAENYVDATGRMLGGPIHSMNAGMLAKHKGDAKAAAAEAVAVYCAPVYFALSLIGSGLAQVRQPGANKSHRRKAEMRDLALLDYRVVHVDKLRIKVAENIDLALKHATKAWDNLDRDGYGKPKDSEMALATELKTYQFRIK